MTGCMITMQRAAAKKSAHLSSPAMYPPTGEQLPSPLPPRIELRSKPLLRSPVPGLLSGVSGTPAPPRFLASSSAAAIPFPPPRPNASLPLLPPPPLSPILSLSGDRAGAYGSSPPLSPPPPMVRREAWRSWLSSSSSMVDEVGESRNAAPGELLDGPVEVIEPEEGAPYGWRRQSSWKDG